MDAGRNFNLFREEQPQIIKFMKARNLINKCQELFRSVGTLNRSCWKTCKVQKISGILLINSHTFFKPWNRIINRWINRKIWFLCELNHLLKSLKSKQRTHNQSKIQRIQTNTHIFTHTHTHCKPRHLFPH